MTELPPGGRAAATKPTSRWLLRLALALVLGGGLVMLIILVEARTFDPVEHGALPVPESQILWAVTPDAATGGMPAGDASAAGTGTRGDVVRQPTP